MKRYDPEVGGVPVDVTTTRKETVMIEMEGSVRLIERILEDKAISTVKRAMNEYVETLTTPWTWFDDNLTVSTEEIVTRLQVGGFPFKILIGGDGLMKWGYSHQWSAQQGHTGEQWSNILDVPITIPTYADAMTMWQDALLSEDVKHGA